MSKLVTIIFKEILSRTRQVLSSTPRRRVTSCFKVTLMAVAVLVIASVTLTSRDQSDVTVKRRTPLQQNVASVDQKENDVAIELQTSLANDVDVVVENDADVERQKLLDASDASDATVTIRRQMEVPRCNCSKWILPSHSRLVEDTQSLCH